jgi:alpha-N-acetylglucosaminidase
MHIAAAQSQVYSMLERISPGASSRFIIKETGTPEDFFELSSSKGKVVITGNNAISAAVGLNWYLKYYAGVHLAWNNMSASLPKKLPLPAKKERHSTVEKDRYYLNYCTHSYSMAFWDWDRWEKEIDWMALHGINMPLAITGVDVVWRNIMRHAGYTNAEIADFIAGPGFQAWWMMNNLEGWGGPNSEQWYADCEALQHKILARMREYGMKPVLPGYGGMVPHDFEERYGVSVAGKGLWNKFVRPAFLQPTEPIFDKIADMYYTELTRLYGKADYYSMDPFHEGGSTDGVDMCRAGHVILDAMHRANPDAVWVLQGWSGNPRADMIDDLPKGSVLVLDLASEIRPQWGEPNSMHAREDGYGKHDWLFCMLLNFGGNVGLHGKMDYLLEEYYKAKESKFGPNLTGIGLTMEAIENNPVMYELMSELPWRETPVTKAEWLKGYTRARYGAGNAYVDKAWEMLSNTIYNCPGSSIQQGTTESIFCARPGMEVYQVSKWSRMSPYYEPQDVIDAAGLFIKAADNLKDSPNFQYDIVDIVRQAVAEKGRLTYPEIISAIKAGDKQALKVAGDKFLNLIMLQDKLLATMPDFKVGKWIADARRLAPSDAERDLFEWNARVLITTWGPRDPCERGLRDYAHREWNGILADFYYNRWAKWLDLQMARLDGQDLPDLDYYSIEEPWTLEHKHYSEVAEGDPVATAVEVFHAL